MSVSAGSAFRLVQFGHYLQVCLLASCYDHLRNALSRVNGEVGIGQVYQHHPYLAAIVGIDGAGGVEHRYAVFQGQPLRGRTCAS